MVIIVRSNLNKKQGLSPMNRHKPKKQHYVPQFVLRAFSSDKKNIQCLLKTLDRFIPKASIRGQCKEKYSYGKNGIIEGKFGELESQVSKIIRNIGEKKYTSSMKDPLITFIFYQIFRTPKAALIFNQPKCELRELIIESLRRGMQLLPIFADLDLKIISNEREIDFITSDHPVVIFNPWAQFDKILNKVNVYGLGSKGLMVFMPFSTKLGILLYDPSTYSVGSKSKHFVFLSKKDVINLNKVQLHNAYECVYTMDIENVGLNIRRDTRKITHTPISNGFSIFSKLSHKLSFVETIDRITFNKAPDQLPLRSQELVNIARSTFVTKPNYDADITA